MRLFIAISIEDQLRKRLSHLQDDLKATQAHLRLVRPENIHLTMRFLGEVGEDKTSLIVDLIKKVASGYHAFQVELKTVGAFPRVESPRVVWVGCEELNTKDLPQIYQAIEKGLSGLGFAKDDHGFSAHITLARTKSSKNRHKLIELLKTKTGFSAGTQTVNQISLFQSQLHPTGPVYTVIDSGILAEK